MEGQLSLYEDDEYLKEIEINEKGEISIIEEDINSIVDFLRPINATALDTRKFVENFDDNVNKAYNYVRSLQKNKLPLKRGGEDVVYRAEALIIANKQTYNIHEDKLFDLLLTTVGSDPDAEVYQLTIADMRKNLPDYDTNYLYEIFEKGQEGLKNKPLLFKTNNKNNDVLSVAVPWFDVFVYLKRGRDSVDTNTLTFKPNIFFRLLASSSGITHGAHYRLSVSSRFSQRYVKNLFVLLEDKKRYIAFPGAQMGQFQMTIEEMKEILNIPASYKANDIKRRVIEVLKNEMSMIDNIDIYFDYAPVYFTGVKRAGKSKIVGFKFTVMRIVNQAQRIDAKNDNLNEQIEDKKEENNANVPASFIEMFIGIGLNKDDAKRVAKKAKENNRDVVFLAQAISAISNKPNIKSKTAALCDMMDNGIWTEDKKNTEKKKTNGFNNFSQRTYDMEELEKKLLARN